MDDSRIVALYWKRSERAIDATAAKYGRYCYAIAYNILACREDADECVDDTYIGAWRSIPPHRPTVLATFLGKLTRRISLNRWRSLKREKRGGGEVPLALEEFSECVRSSCSTERAAEEKELSQAISAFLGTLPEAEREVFVCRYWFLAGVKEISGKFGYTEGKVKSMLFRTRNKLREYLTEEELV